GAAAALLAGWLGVGQVRQDLVLPDGEVGLEARVSPAEGGWLVEQSWVGVRLAASQVTLAGRDVAVCSGTLNNYLLVRLPDGSAGWPPWPGPGASSTAAAPTPCRPSRTRRRAPGSSCRPSTSSCGRGRPTPPPGPRRGWRPEPSCTREVR